MPPTLSVVMVSYFTGPALFRAIDAALAEEGVGQLCLVDNGNSEADLTRLRAFRHDPKFHLIMGHGNIGFGRACNLGAKAATGEMVLMLNPDCFLSPGSATRLLAIAERLTRPFILSARIVNEDGSDQRGARRALLTPETAFVEAFHLGSFFPRYRLNFNADEVAPGVSPMPAVSGAFMLMHLDDYWRVGGYDEGYFLHVEDLDLCLRFRRAGGEIYFTSDVTITHIGGTSAASSAFIERHKARGFVRYFKRNFSASPRLLLWGLFAAIWVRCWLKIGLGRRRG